MHNGVLPESRKLIFPPVFSEAQLRVLHMPGSLSIRLSIQALIHPTSIWRVPAVGQALRIREWDTLRVQSLLCSGGDRQVTPVIRSRAGSYIP